MTGRQIQIFILHILMTVIVYFITDLFIVPISFFKYFLIELMCLGGFALVKYAEKL